MDGIWLEDGSFQPAPGAKGKLKGKGKGKGKGKKGKGKGKGKEEEEPEAKRQKLDEPVEEKDEIDFDWEWQDRLVCLVNLKAASLNGTYGTVKEYMGSETIIVEGKKKKVRRLLVALQGGKGEKSIKLENLFKVMTGSLVKLRGLDKVELNDSVAECGKLDVETMRYVVTLSDGRDIKVKPPNVEYYANYEGAQVAGDSEYMEWFRTAASLKDKLTAIEEMSYPATQLLPAASLEVYAKKFPKSVVIGHSNAAHPKGAQLLLRDVCMAANAPPGARIIFISVPRDKCVAPGLTEMRHDDLLRLSKFAEWVSKRCTPRPVYFVLPGIAAKGPTSLLTAATCAWPLTVEICTDMLLLDSERWKKSPWARLDALLAVWSRRPIYVLPEKYAPPIEMGDGGREQGPEEGENKQAPLSFKPEEPLTIERPIEAAAAAAAPAGSQEALLAALAARAAEVEKNAANVKCPTLAVRRL
mmetsp:Transcript_55756/g.121859  ORF Transcript_55756/g.121859 Transcript_55756/m.121859 type:complete len:470 (-) Transcript_55756:86-1495(-)